ncbi:MAG: hypothetical protein PHS31_04000 [Victivallaceae bacterium]|nr:hypothetical protein [Victivallaceae bacterium]
MKRFGVMLSLSAIVCGGAFSAEEVLKISETEDFLEPVKIVEINEERFFEVNPGVFKSTKAFKIDRKKAYLLKGSFRKLSQEDIYIYFGFVPLDSSDQRISPQDINCAPETGTELAEEVKVGDTTVKLKNGADWGKVNKRWFAVAFNVKDDFSDLPNRDLSPRIDSVSGNEITLSSPIKRAYPVGTKVREQFAGDSFLYTAALNRKLSSQWQEFSGEIQGEKWGAGAIKARILIYPLPSKDNRQEKIQFKDISVKSVD